LLSLWEREAAQGRDVAATELCADRPDLVPELERRVQAVRHINDLARSTHTGGPHAAQPGDTQPTVGGPGAIRKPIPACTVPGYEVLRELGHGGMGVVYLARHLKLNRVVALKMILHGAHAGAGRLSRFLVEAEAIARLQHPNIVQIFEAGEHEGLPYFTLEHVAGGSLANKVREQPLPPREAAALVEQLARGTAYAHGRGIIHRDLKPENVLLASGDDPSASVVPKITDFGLAKRIEGDSGMTGSGAVMGTPSYMAPEQARGQTSVVGPPADIYALGAILYRLLTGRPPFQAASVMDTLVQVMDADPVPPSRLQPKLPRDLETICLKCLHKEPARRYATAGDLADDLRRYQNGQPIAARPITVFERTLKWVRRRPAVALLSLLVVLVALLGLAGILVNWQEAVRQERLAALNATSEQLARIDAERAGQAAREAAKLAEENAGKEKDARLEAQEAEGRALAAAAKAHSEAEQRAKVAQFLVGLFEAADPIGYYGYSMRASNETGQKLTARELLDRGAKKIKGAAQVDPLTQATLMDTIGNVYRNLGLYEDAAGLLKSALALRRDHLQKDDPDLATSLHNLAWWYYERGNMRQAEKLYREALAIRLEKLGPEDHNTIATKMNLGWLLTIKGDFAQAEKVLREVLAVRLKQNPAKSREVAIAQLSLAAMMLDRGDRNFEVLGLVQAATATLAELEGDNSITVAVAQFQTGVVTQGNGYHAAAVKHFQNALKAAVPFFDKDNPYVGAIHYHLAISQEALGKLDDAEAELRTCVDICRKTVTLLHPKALLPVERLANLLGKRKLAAEGGKLLQEVLDLCRAHLEPEDIAIAEALDVYAGFLVRYGDRERAAAMYAEAVAIFDKNEVFRLHPYYSALVGLAQALIDRGEHVSAEELLQKALALEDRKAGLDDDRVALRVALTTTLLAQGKAGAVKWGRQALAVHRTNKHWSRAAALALQLSKLHCARGELDEAETHAREALAAAQKSVAKQPLRLLVYLEQLAHVLACRGNYGAARPLVQQALAILQAHPLGNATHQAECARQLALLDLAQGSRDTYRRDCELLAILAGECGDEAAAASLLATAAIAPEGMTGIGSLCAQAQALVERHPENAAYLDALGHCCALAAITTRRLPR
jgi:tetratricopeptide (TPR) repeat protein